VKHGVILLSDLLDCFDKFQLLLIDCAMAMSPKHQDIARNVEIWEENENMSKISDLKGQIVNI